MLKSVVFEWFHFLHLFINWVSGGKVLGVILEFVGGLGDTFFIFEGPGNKLEFLCILGCPLGSPRLRGYRSGR